MDGVLISFDAPEICETLKETVIRTFLHRYCRPERKTLAEDVCLTV